MFRRQFSTKFVSLVLTGGRNTEFKICQSMLREHRSRAKASLISNVVGTTLLGVLMQFLNPNVQAAYWMLLMAIIFPLEYVSRHWLKPKSEVQNAFTGMVFVPILFAVFRGSGWGLGGYLFFEEQLEYEMFLAMLLCCVSVFGAALLSSYLLSAVLFIVCVLAPSIALLVQSAVPFFHVLGFAGMAYCGIAIGFAVLTNRMALKAFRLNDKNIELIDALQESNRELETKNQELNFAMSTIVEIATRDELTGCYNRRYMMDSLRQELAVSQRDSRPFTFLLIDVDHFKKINDSYGHLVGDRVLAGIAQTLELTVRNMDTLARFGGEEFACMLPGTTAEDAAFLADRIRQAIASQSVAYNGAPLKVTVSIGVAQWLFDESIESVIHRADLGLYAAKAKGRNCVVTDNSSPPELFAVSTT
jgi:diguanylate cyclase (GGDEF)-like protein